VQLVDVTDRAGEHDVRAVLAPLAWRGESAQLDRVVALYSTGPRLFALEEGEELLGVIGVERTDEGTGIIRHIAVEPQSRGRGIGRTMVESVAALMDVSTLQAETDDDGVGFYEACGFTVHSLGRKYPGVERFTCERGFD
jgi:N-acetylglutamate synthase-like GNAT family acetyltransferase